MKRFLIIMHKVVTTTATIKMSKFTLMVKAIIALNTIEKKVLFRSMMVAIRNMSLSVRLKTLSLNFPSLNSLPSNSSVLLSFLMASLTEAAILFYPSLPTTLKNVRVNVTVSAGRDDLAQEVKVSAFDHDGEYSVQVEHGHFHRPHRYALQNIKKGKKEKGHKKKNCLIYNVAVEIPSKLDYFDQLNIKAKDGVFKDD
ncbi:hypothetical protein BD408DRAFT_138267 [Parasitella parasitica]|nr:hypothetical protein BD408DRAFT_138267 [Parasitella parasitica]